MSSSKILFQLTGSISCFKAAQVISQLVQGGHQVQVVASSSALKFVGTATLEGLTGRKVATELFAEGQMMDHIHLTRWADAAVLCPASAHALNSLSQGLGSDLIGSLSLAWPKQKPYLIFPAMNSLMWEHPATQSSVERLQSFGYQVQAPAQGSLACGEVGWGRLPEPSEIEKIIVKALVTHPSPDRRPQETVLITGGGTREPIDGVRYLSNFSTGRTAASLANSFLAAGYRVIFLHGLGACLPFTTAGSSGGSLERIEFTSHQSLLVHLTKILRQEDLKAVIMAAAVSDFSVRSILCADGTEITDREILGPESLKLSSAQDLQIHLRRNSKILPQIKELAKPSSPVVIGFKLTHQASEEDRRQKVSSLFASGGVDAVVHNDLSEISPDGVEHLSALYVRGDFVEQWKSKDQMAQGLIKLVEVGL